MNIAVAQNGDLFYSGLGGSRIEMLTRNRVRTVIAGSLPVSPECASGQACSTQDRETSGVSVLRTAALTAANGGLYIVDSGANKILFLNTGTKEIRVHGVLAPPGKARSVAGNGTIGASGDGKRALQAQFSGDGEMALDGKGNLFFADTANKRIRSVDRQGNVETLVPPADQPGRSCCYLPTDVALDRHENFFVLDGRIIWYINRTTSSKRIYGEEVAPNGMRLVAGTGELAAEGVRAGQAAFRSPGALAFDRQSDALYIADAGEHTVRRIDRDGKIGTAVGTGQAGFNGDGKKGQLTMLSSPSDIATDPCGNLLIADQTNDRIRRLGSRPCIVDSSAGTGEAGSKEVSPFLIRSAPRLLILGLVFAALGGTGVWFLERKRNRN